MCSENIKIYYTENIYKLTIYLYEYIEKPMIVYISAIFC